MTERRLPDPTYARDQIEANPEWSLAFFLSECMNDDAPIGWHRYVPVARSLLRKYRVVAKGEPA